MNPHIIKLCLGTLALFLAPRLHAVDVGIIGGNALYWEKVFREAYVPANSIQFIDDFSKFKVMVVTPNAVRDDSAPFIRNAEKFKRYVKDGGFLLSLHQNDRSWTDKWLPWPAPNRNGAYPLARIEQKDHPLFAGVEERELGVFNNGIIIQDAFANVAPEWNVLCTNVSADGKQKHITAMEGEFGKGRVLALCFNPYVELDRLTKKDIKKLQITFNAVQYALATQGIQKRPDLQVFVEKMESAPLALPGVTLANSQFHRVSKVSRPAGVTVAPTGLLLAAHYFGAVHRMTKDKINKYERQKHHLFQEGFVAHWKENGAKRMAGVHPGYWSRSKAGGERIYSDIEIPSSLLDENTSYTSLVSAGKDARIEIVSAVQPNGKFILKEFTLTNIGPNAMKDVELHQFVCLSFMTYVKGYHGPFYYQKDLDMFLAVSESKGEKLPVLEEICAFAGTRKSNAHSIAIFGALFGGGTEMIYSEKEGRNKGRLITGASNNKNRGNNAGILVWPLGDLKPGESSDAGIIIAVGDNRADLDRQLADARSYYQESKPFKAKADRKALLAKHASLNWKVRTHQDYPEFIDRDDPDGDGWNLAREKQAGTDPDKEDTDKDGLLDPVDPHPLTPETVMPKVTAKEIQDDRVIGLSKRKIIRAVRGQHAWALAYDWPRISRYLSMLRHIGVNCISIRVGGMNAAHRGVAYGDGVSFGYKTTDYGDRDLMAEFIAACHRYDIDVRLEGLVGKYVGSNNSIYEWRDKPGGIKTRIPGYSCVNGWIRGVTAAMIFDVAKYPAEFMCIDEERYFRCHNRERFQTGICMCPVCVNRFRHEMGYDMPGLKEASEGKDMVSFFKQFTGRKAFELHQWRRKCATEAWRYWVHVAKSRNPEIKFMQQSVNEGGPYHRGGLNARESIKGVDLGYKAGMYYGGDHHYYPYRYSGRLYANHFVWPGAMKAAMASVPNRLGWVEYGGEFRAWWAPVWCYGQFISAIAQGGKAVEYFALAGLPKLKINFSGDMLPLHGPPWAAKITGTDGMEYLKMAYTTLDKLNDWIFPASPPKQIAFLWNGSADEAYGVLDDIRKYALSRIGRTHSHFMTYLFRTGYPFDIHYLHYADDEALKDYPVLVMPASLCVAKDRVPMLEKLVRNGARLIIIGEYGQLDTEGHPHERGALLDLAGIENVGSLEIETGQLATHNFLKDIDVSELTFSVRKDISLKPGTTALATMSGTSAGITIRTLGKGKVIFMPGNFVATSLYPHEVTHTGHIPHTFDITKSGTKLMNAILNHSLGEDQLITRYERLAPDSNADIEINILENGPKEKILFLINWEEKKKSILNLGLNLPKARYKITEYSMKPSDKSRIDKMKPTPFTKQGKTRFTKDDFTNWRIELEPQQIRILRIRG